MPRISKNISLGKDKNGKRIRKRIYGNSPTDLQRNIVKYIKEYQNQSEPTGLTFKTYSETWLETKASRQAATIEMYENALRKTGDIDYMLLEEITRDDLQKLLNKHIKHPTACSQLHLTLKQIFKMAVVDRLITGNPSLRLEIPNKDKIEERPLTEEEKEAVRKAELSERDKMYILILYYFGLRPQEAFGLQPCDIDAKRHILHIRRAVGYSHNLGYIKSSKTYKQREIPIPDAFFDQLIKYSTQYKKSEFMIGNNGCIMNKSQRYDMWDVIKAELFRHMENETDIHPYTFRHNFCKECYMRRISVKMTAKLMGNTPQTVMKFYLHLDQSLEPLDSLKTLKL